MIIHGKFVERIAYVDTDEGCFKVFADGTINRWTDNEITHESYYCWFDEGKFDEADIAEIRRVGLSLLQ